MKVNTKRILSLILAVFAFSMTTAAAVLYLSPNRAVAIDRLRTYAIVATPLAAALLVSGILIYLIVRKVKKSAVFAGTRMDTATGLPNREAFNECVESELEKAKKTSEPLCLALIDIDDFRTLNNTYGHAAGDKVLAGVARGIRSQARKNDFVFRTGGDEFALVMPNTRLLDGQHLCERISNTTTVAIDGIALKPMLTGGIASYPYHARDNESLYRLAHDAMHWAKYHGKDQVAIFDFETMEALRNEVRLRKAEDMAYQRTAQTLAVAMEGHHDNANSHANNVATLAEIFASRLNLSKHKIDMIRIAALVHDIGKIGMANLAVKRPSDLTEEERVKLQEHPMLCTEVLIATDLAAIMPWVTAHHERWDGGGYPGGLEGNRIPYEARIIALCDEYENLTRPRHEGEALSHREAVGEIMSQRGRKFDPVLTDSFVHLVDLLNSMLINRNVRKTPDEMPSARLTEVLDTFGQQPAPKAPDNAPPADLYALVRSKLETK
jgi:diguanylate cyclase (GGDEF)-like protein